MRRRMYLRMRSRWARGRVNGLAFRKCLYEISRVERDIEVRSIDFVRIYLLVFGVNPKE